MTAVRTGSAVMLAVVSAAVLLAAPPPKPTSLAATAVFDGGGAVTTSGPLGGSISSGIYSVRVTSTGSSPALAVDLGGFLSGTRECATATLARCNPDGPYASTNPPVLFLS